MSILHTVNKSPFERVNLDSCLGHAQDGDLVLLIEDGVFAALNGTSLAGRIATEAKRLKLYVLTADLEARGLDPANVVAGVEKADYGTYVDLAAEASAVHAWL